MINEVMLGLQFRGSDYFFGVRSEQILQMSPLTTPPVKHTVPRCERWFQQRRAKPFGGLSLYLVS